MLGKVKNQAIDPGDWASARLITIGMLAKAYGQLPSYVLANATTFDIMILDVMMAWEQYQNDRASGKITTPAVDQAVLEEMIRKTRG